MNEQTDYQSPVIVRFRNSLACVPCRSRHVKCDATKPGCTRCQIDGKTCYFMKSRRGMRRKAPSVGIPDIQPATSIDSTLEENTAVKESPHTTSSTSVTTPFISHLLSPNSSLANSTHHAPVSHVGASNLFSAPEVEPENHLNRYYTFFHNAHPWVLPRRRFNRMIKSHKDQIQGLLTVMEFIGSTYTSEGQSAYLRQRALKAMSEPELPKTPFTVQALLILAVGVHCCSDFSLARNTLDRAISIALELGMQFQSYAVLHGNGDPVLAESWRRTWWGIFVIEGSVEAIMRTTNFTTWHVHSDVDLPCEEIDYENECIPPPQTLAAYRERDLAEFEISYSSFAYLIDIVTISGGLMASRSSIPGEGITEKMVDDADGSLVNWKFHLPDDKKNILRPDGEIDEPLFHAHMKFYVIHVHLHRARSRLVHSPIEDTAKCAAPPPPADIPWSKRESYWLSTKKTMDAAERAINIFTLPGSLLKHTPMVVCGVVIAILAELSACCYILEGDQNEASRNRIRLGIGTLKEYGKAWPVGHQSLIEVKSIAREVFAIASSRKNFMVEEALSCPNASGSLDTLDIQSYFDEFGALDYLSMLDMPVV